MSYCSWDQSSELNIKYHDTEWGVPLHDDRGQFEFLMMEVMQCGLNWTMYSHLQACGIINDHDKNCPCYKKIVKKYPTVTKKRFLEKQVMYFGG